MKIYTYFLLHLITVLFPLLWSFERRVTYYRKWKYVFPAIAITAAFFILWDHYFTAWGVWSFNPAYITGTYLLGLPLEELLFFITVPFSCIFIYEALNYYFPNDYFSKYSRQAGIICAIVFALLALANTGKWYTMASFGTASVMLLVHLSLFGNKIMSRFILAYLVHLIPFFVINGILTALPVVMYNDQENLGIRMGTIPAEDSVYSMTLLLMNITLYETFRSRTVTQAKYVV